MKMRFSDHLSGQAGQRPSHLLIRSGTLSFFLLLDLFLHLAQKSFFTALPRRPLFLRLTSPARLIT